MWVFRNDAFVSVVQDRANPDLLWVRGRVKGDVERFLGDQMEGVEVATTPEADYLYRCRVPRDYVVSAMMDAAASVDYENFKGSIPKTKRGDLRHDFYMRVWTAMMAFQRRLVPKSGYWYPKRPKGLGWFPEHD